MAISAADQNFLVSLYTGYFNRAPDPVGLQFWIDQVEAGRALNTIAADFAQSAEATALYPFLTTPDVSTTTSFITSVYQNLFNRAPDAAGLAFWQANIDPADPVSVANAIESIIAGAVTAPDSTIMANKIKAGLDFAIDAGNTAGFTFDAAAKSVATSAINGVDATDASVTAAAAATDAFLAGAANVGATFALTTGVDAVAGSAANDTITASETAASSVLGALDAVDGGAGVDTFSVADTAKATDAAFTLNGVTLTNVEKLTVATNGDFAGFDISGIAGLTSAKLASADLGATAHAVTASKDTEVDLTTKSGTVAITGGKTVLANSAAASAVTVAGDDLTSVTLKGGAAGSSVTNTIAGAGTAGKTLTSVTLEDMAVGAKAVAGGAIADLTIKSQKVASAVTITDATTEALTVHADGAGYTAAGAAVAGVSVAAGAAAKTITVDATGSKSNLTVTGAAAKTVNITGDAALTLAPVATATVLDGSAATGDLTLGTLNAATVNVKTGAGKDIFGIAATTKTTVDAGAGDDVVTLTSAIAKGSTINFGAGDDALINAGGSVAVDTATDVTVIDGGAGLDTVSASLFNAGNANQFVNFEALDLSATTATPLDVDLVTGSTIEKLTLVGDGGFATTSVVQNVAVGVGLDVKGDNATGGSTTIGVKGAASDTANTFAITFDGAAAAAAPVAASIEAGSVIVNEVEAVTIASAGGANTWNSAALTADKLQTVTITGDKNLDLTFNAGTGTNTGVGAGGAVNSIDGSTATGKLTINTTNVTADDKAGVGLTVKGGSANDSITLAQKATVNGGAGDDMIISSAAGGSFTGGAGSDEFDVTLAVATGTTEATSVFTTIADFAAGDKIDFAAGASGAFNTTAVVLGAGVTNLDQALAAIGTANAANETSYANYGTDTYVVNDTDGSGTFTAGDTVVKLAGVIDLSSATFAATELTAV